MNKSEFVLLLKETHERMCELTVTKGEEYAGEGQQRDQLQNFIDAGIDAGIRSDQAWLVHFNKHVNAIKAYIRTGAVKSEPIEGRIDDAILYLILFKALVRDRLLAGQAPSAFPGGVPPAAREDE